MLVVHQNMLYVTDLNRSRCRLGHSPLPEIATFKAFPRIIGGLLNVAVRQSCSGSCIEGCDWSSSAHDSTSARLQWPLLPRCGVKLYWCFDFFPIRHLKNEDNEPNKLSQRGLGLLLGTEKKMANSLPVRPQPRPQ